MEAGRQKLITADILKEMKEKDRSKEQSWEKKKIEHLEVKTRMIKIKTSRVSTSRKM